MITGDLSGADVDAILESHAAHDVLARTRSIDAFLVLGRGSLRDVDASALARVVENAMRLTEHVTDADRSAALSTVSAMAASVDVSPALADVVLQTIVRHGMPGIRAVLRVSWSAVFGLRPQTVSAVLDCAAATTATKRYPALGALATAARESPGLFAGMDFSDLIRSTLGGMVDGVGRIEARAAAAVGVLASLSTDPVIRVLGKTVSALAAHAVGK